MLLNGASWLTLAVAFKTQLAFNYLTLLHDTMVTDWKFSSYLLRGSNDRATELILMKKTLTSVVPIQKNVSRNRVRYENPSPRTLTE